MKMSLGFGQHRIHLVGPDALPDIDILRQCSRRVGRAFAGGGEQRANCQEERKKGRVGEWAKGRREDTKRRDGDKRMRLGSGAIGTGRQTGPMGPMRHIGRIGVCAYETRLSHIPISLIRPILVPSRRPVAVSPSRQPDSPGKSY
jgi:hypothetical protein